MPPPIAEHWWPTHRTGRLPSGGRFETGAPRRGVDGRQGLVEAVDGFGEQVGAHHATALVGGNQCISGNGAVVGASSR